MTLNAYVVRATHGWIVLSSARLYTRESLNWKRRSKFLNMSESIFNDGILKGRVAFVTGGGTGITGGVARALAEAGATVALVSRKLDHLEPAANAINDNGGKAIAVAADVRQPEEVDKAIAQTVEQLGKIDIIVNGAAGNFLCAAEELSPNGFGTVIDIDLKGTF